MKKCLTTELSSSVNAVLPFAGYVRRKMPTGEGCELINDTSDEAAKLTFRMVDGGFFGNSTSSTSGDSEANITNGLLYPSKKGTMLIPKNYKNTTPFSTNELYMNDCDKYCKFGAISLCPGDIIGETGVELPNLSYIKIQDVSGLEGNFSDFAKYKNLKVLNPAFGQFTNIFYSQLFTQITTYLPNLEVVRFGNAMGAEMPVRTSDMPVLIVTGAGNLKGVQLSDANILAYFKNQANCKAGEYKDKYDIKIAADSSKVTSISGLRDAIDVIKGKGYKVKFNDVEV